MVMLSTLLRRGRQKDLDLEVDPSAGDYPVVTRLVWKLDSESYGSQQVSFTATGANSMIQISEPRSEEFAVINKDQVAALVLLRRDVLDALVLDLDDGQPVRANDLWLEDIDGQLVLRAADVSPLAVIRRLLPLGLGDRLKGDLIDWKYIEFLRGTPSAAETGADYHRRITSLPPARIARLSDGLPYLHAAELLTQLPVPLAADVLEAMAIERQVPIMEEIDRNQAISIIDRMAPDSGALLLANLNPDVAIDLLQGLPSPRQDQIAEILSFPEATAGSIMANDFVAVRGDQSVAEAQKDLKGQVSEPDFVYYVYVVEDARTRRLMGVITLRDMLVAEPETHLSELMKPTPISIGPLELAATAARRLAYNQLNALPVIAEDGRILGVITVDAAIAQLAPASWREVGPRVFS